MDIRIFVVYYEIYNNFLSNSIVFKNNLIFGVSLN